MMIIMVITQSKNRTSLISTSLFKYFSFEIIIDINTYYTSLVYIFGPCSTCEHRGMGTIKDDELRHHFWIVNGKQPCDGPAPVMAHQETSVVALEKKA